MSRETFEFMNLRVSVDRPTVTRDQIESALRSLGPLKISPESMVKVEEAIATLFEPTLEITATTHSSLLINLPLYQHIRVPRQVRALKIAAVIPNPRGIELHFDNTRFTPIQVSNRWAIDWAPAVGGYYGQTEKNGEPFTMDGPAFEGAYTMIEVGA